MQNNFTTLDSKGVFVENCLVGDFPLTGQRRMFMDQYMAAAALVVGRGDRQRFKLGIFVVVCVAVFLGGVIAAPYFVSKNLPAPVVGLLFLGGGFAFLAAYLLADKFGYVGHKKDP